MGQADTSQDPFGADVFGDSVADIDVWAGDDWKQPNDAKFAQCGSKDGDDFTIATVSTRHSASGHSFSTIGSRSTASGSTINSQGSNGSVLEDLSASKPVRRRPRKTRSLKSDSRPKNQDIQWNPNPEPSEPEKPRSLRRGLSEAVATETERPRPPRRGLSECGTSSSQRNLVAPKKPFSIKDLKEDEQLRISEKARQNQSTPSKPPPKPRSFKKSDKSERPRSRKSQKASTPNEECQRSLKQLFQDDKPVVAKKRLDSQKGAGSNDPFEVISVADRKETGLDRRAGLMRSHSQSMLSKSSRKLGSLDDSTACMNMSMSNFQRHSGRPALGRSSSFKMSVKHQRTEEPKNTDGPRDGEEKPPSRRRNLGRTDSLGGSNHGKARRRTPGESSKASRPPAAGARRTKRSTPGRSSSCKEKPSSSL